MQMVGSGIEQRLNLNSIGCGFYYAERGFPQFRGSVTLKDPRTPSSQTEEVLRVLNFSATRVRDVIEDHQRRQYRRDKFNRETIQVRFELGALAGEPVFHLEQNGWLIPNDVWSALPHDQREFLTLLGGVSANLPTHAHNSEHAMRFLHSYRVDLKNVTLPFGACVFHRQVIW